MNKNWDGVEWESGTGLIRVALRIAPLVVPRGV
jgi:hypothetical protein